jgi:arsenical pump membrane protein
MSSDLLKFPVWIISCITFAGVIFRPFKVQEVYWAVGAALLLVLFGLLLPSEALKGIYHGTDVYLFLTGMMLLAETAREEKLFDWLAANAVEMAKGSPVRLFSLVYVVGIIVTAFLSNDATAVVLTPAVAAATRAAKVKNPIPYLLICAFIANAASFILPISNPANLVIYGQHMPSLLYWLRLFLVPSAVAIATTYVALRYTQRKMLAGSIESAIEIPTLGTGGKSALYGIIATGLVLLIFSSVNIDLGLPTAITGILTSAFVIIQAKKKPATILKGVSWSVIPLVAGLFVIVEALSKTGIMEVFGKALYASASAYPTASVWGSGLLVALACNLMNNLPAGLIAGHILESTPVSELIKSAVLIGVDLGPNLSISGSLATILWMVALRREGIHISFGMFIKLGAVVMTLALVLTLGTLWLLNC